MRKRKGENKGVIFFPVSDEVNGMFEFLLLTKEDVKAASS